MRWKKSVLKLTLQIKEFIMNAIPSYTVVRSNPPSPTPKINENQTTQLEISKKRTGWWMAADGQESTQQHLLFQPVTPPPLLISTFSLLGSFTGVCNNTRKQATREKALAWMKTDSLERCKAMSGYTTKGNYSHMRECSKSCNLKTVFGCPLVGLLCKL